MHEPIRTGLPPQAPSFCVQKEISVVLCGLEDEKERSSRETINGMMVS